MSFKTKSEAKLNFPIIDNGCFYVKHVSGGGKVSGNHAGEALQYRRHDCPDILNWGSIERIHYLLSHVSCHELPQGEEKMQMIFSCHFLNSTVFGQLSLILFLEGFFLTFSSLSRVSDFSVLSSSVSGSTW